MLVWLSLGLTTTQNSIRTTSDFDWSSLTDTRSAENDQIGADTDPEYRIDSSLLQTVIVSTSDLNRQANKGEAALNFLFLQIIFSS